MGCESSLEPSRKRRYKNEFLNVFPTIQIGNKSFEAKGIVDTASNRTCFSRNFVEKHNLIPFLKKTETSIKCSSGDSVFTQWEIPNVKIKFDKVNKCANVIICVIENLPVPFLIGTDTLKSLGNINLDFHKRQVQMNDIILLNENTP